MLSRALCSLVLASVAVLATASAQEADKPAAPKDPDTQIMDWVFAMPEGWRVANSRLTLLLTKDLAVEHTARASEALTQLTFGQPVDIEGDFGKWFNVHWENLKKDYKSPDLKAPTESDAAAGYKVIAGGGAMNLGNGKNRVVMLIGVNKGKRAGVMCFLTEDHEQLDANAKRLDGLLATVRFASQRAPGDKAPALRTKIDPAVTPSYQWDNWKGWPKGDAPLQGLWGRQSLQVQFLGTNWTTTYRSSYVYLLFFKDGTVLTRMPPEGLLSFDVDFLKNEFKDYFGTYTVEGDTVTVTTGGGDRVVETQKFTRKGDELHQGTAVYKPIADEKPVLDGGYIKVDYKSHADLFHKGILFAADGRFADEGFNAMLNIKWWQGGNYWLLEQFAEPGTGRWRVEKNTLELTYDDGRKRRFGFHLHRYEGPEPATYLVLNTMFMMQHPINATLPPKDSGAATPAPQAPMPVQPAAEPAREGQQAAADTQVYDWLFAMPEGWRLANSRLTQMTKELAVEHTARCSEALTQLTFGRPGDIEGDFRKWFDGHWENLKKDYKAPGLDAPSESVGAAGHKLVAGMGAIKMDDGRQRVVMLIGVNKGKRAGVMCFITEDLEHVEANARRMDGLLASVSFASQRAPGEKAPALRNRIDPLVTPSFLRDDWKGWPAGSFPLEGLWGRETVTPDLWTHHGQQYRSTYFYRMFFKDGTVLNRMPTEGLLSFDLAWLRSEFADYIGTYTVAGNVVTVTTGAPGKQQLKEELTLKGDDLYLGEAPYRRITDDAPALDGAYIKIDYQRHAPESHKRIVFSPKGSFVDEGFNSILGVHWWCGDKYWLWGHPAEPGNGKWRIEKNTLELIYDDGRKHRYAFHVHRDIGNKGLKYLVLNGRFLMRLGDADQRPPERPAEPTPEPAPVVAGADTRVSDWEFAMPKGWSVKAGARGQPTLRPAHTPTDLESWAEFSATEAIKGEFAAWFDKQWQPAKKKYGVEQADPAQGGLTDNKYDMLAAAALGSHGGKQCLVMLTALHKAGRAATLTFVSTDLERLAPDIEALDALLPAATLASCRAPGEPAPNPKVRIDPLCTPSFLWDPAPAPITGDQPLSGIYGTPSMRATGVSGPAANELVFKYYTFFPDGRVLRQMPPEGLLSFRYEFWQQHYKFDCGRYKIDGDQVVVTLDRPEGEPEVVKLKREGDILVNGDVKYRPIAQDQPKPEGRWLRMNHEKREELFQLGITFNKDGTFKDEGFNSTTRIGWWCGSDYLLRDVEAGPVAGAGKWRVEKNTLELVYDDGRKRRFGYHMHESDGKKHLVLNGDYFTP